MIEFLSPLSREVKEFRDKLPAHSLGKFIDVYLEEGEVPSVEEGSLVLIGVLENRNSDDELPVNLDLDSFRKEFYSLYKGNWNRKIIDLGDVVCGHARKDSRFALQVIVTELLRLEALPIILGGPQDLVYSQYRAYDGLKKMINVVNVDSRFDLGDTEGPLSNKSYMGRVIVDEPYNLNNYSVIGYQSFFNPPEEIALMDKLFFDAYRLGEVTKDITIAEPVMRGADMVSVDMTSIEAAHLNSGRYYSPNGWNGREICALARYAGISNKLTSFGIYELSAISEGSGALLVAEILWYFIEGVNFRIEDEDFGNDDYFTTYLVPIEEMDLTFIKSNKSGRWWIDMPFLPFSGNKFISETLLPCTREDYLAACNQEIPERWLKARLKNEGNL